jgi:hypothetical protein
MCCYAASNLSKNPANSVKFMVAGGNEDDNSSRAGFGQVVVTAENITVNYYDVAGNIVYTTKPILPRTSRR